MIALQGTPEIAEACPAQNDLLRSTAKNGENQIPNRQALPFHFAKRPELTGDAPSRKSKASAALVKPFLDRRFASNSSDRALETILKVLIP